MHGIERIKKNCLKISTLFILSQKATCFDLNRLSSDVRSDYFYCEISQILQSVYYNKIK